MSKPRHPFLLALDAVMKADCPYSPVERWVAAALARHMDESGSAWPSARRLQEVTGLGETAVRAAIVRLCEGEAPLFYRTVGGARAGARYESSHYRLRAEVEGFATRGARETRGSSGEVEGFATRGRGVRHATTERAIERAIEEARAQAPGAGGNQSSPGTSRPGRETGRRQRPAKARHKADTPEARAVVEAHYEILGKILGSRSQVTTPKLDAAQRALSAGFTVEQLSEVFRAVAAAPEEGAGRAVFCRHKNHAFEYLLRPETLQTVLDQAGPTGPRSAGKVVDWSTRPFHEREAHEQELAEREALRAGGRA